MAGVKTGDALLFSGNSPTGFLLRTFVSSEWNHSGIAVRFVERNGKKEVSLTEEGELYIFETNTGSRKDIFGNEIIGAGFSEATWVFPKYNKIAVRRLKEELRTPELARLTLDFASQFHGSKFPSSSLPFLGVWLGVDFSDSDTQDEMFCSELMAHYYRKCVGASFETLTGIPGTLSLLFGDEAPPSENMFTPGHYGVARTPKAAIFEPREEIVYTSHADLGYVILQPFLIIVAVMLFLWMSFPK